MNIKQQILTAVLCFCSVSAMASSLTGTTWVTKDDKTGKPHAEVELNETNGLLSGQIVVTFPQPGDIGFCSKCPGRFKDKPIKGLVFLWGLKQKDENTWAGGKVLDPRNGKIYRAKLLLKGDKLYMRGFLGVAVLGKTQIWDKK